MPDQQRPRCPYAAVKRPAPAGSNCMSADVSADQWAGAESVVSEQRTMHPPAPARYSEQTGVKAPALIQKGARQ